MPRLPEIRLPPARRWSRIALAASIGVHSLLLFCWIEGRQPILPRRPSQLIVLAQPAEGPAFATGIIPAAATDSRQRARCARRSRMAV